MRLLVLNPNTTEAMTQRIVAEVRRLAPAGTAVRGLTATFGEPVIASRQAFVVGAHAALRMLLDQGPDPRADAVLLACFGDPGLQALREATRLPVMGMAQAALDAAAALGRPFHIITAGAAWGPMLRETVRLHGSDHLLHGISVLDTTGLSISQDPDAFVARIQAVLDDLAPMPRDHGDTPTVILGGAGFAGMRERLRHPAPLIDGLEAATAAAFRATTAHGPGH